MTPEQVISNCVKAASQFHGVDPSDIQSKDCAPARWSAWWLAYKSGVSITKIAEHFETTRPTVRYRLDRMKNLGAMDESVLKAVMALGRATTFDVTVKLKKEGIKLSEPATLEHLRKLANQKLVVATVYDRVTIWKPR